MKRYRIWNPLTVPAKWLAGVDASGKVEWTEFRSVSVDFESPKAAMAFAATCRDIGAYAIFEESARVTETPTSRPQETRSATEHINPHPGPEDALQADVEGWLRERGYAIPGPATAGTTPHGWYIHLHGRRAMGVAMLPDVLLLSPDWRLALGIELKIGPRPEYQPGQREMIEAGRWVECWSVEDVGREVEQWEAAN